MKLKKIILSITLMSAMLVGCSTKNTSTNVSDQPTTQETTEKEKKELPKISVASVSMSQVLDAMDIDVVGRPKTQLTLPERYKDVTEIGTSPSPDFEKLLEVGTELLIGDLSFKERLEKSAEEYNMDVFYANTSTYDDFLNTIEELGKKLDREEDSTKVIDGIKNSMKKYEGKQSDKKVAIIFGTSESNQLATETSYVGSLVKALGGQNIVNYIAEKDKSILTETGTPYVNLNIEQILANQPDIVLRFGHGDLEAAKKSFEKLFDENPVWKDLDAVKNNKVYDLDSAIFNVSANMRIGEGLEQLGEILYSE